MKTQLKNNSRKNLSKNKRTKKTGKKVSRNRKSRHSQIKGGSSNTNAKINSNTIIKGIKPDPHSDLNTIISVDLNGKLRNFNEIELSLLGEFLATCTSMETLDISNNNLGVKVAEILELLTNLKNLTHLNISNNSLGICMKLKDSNNNCKYGIYHLATFLKHNNSVTNLDISNNNIGNDGITKIHDALSGNTTLETIDLTKNSFNDNNKIKEIEELLKKNKINKESGNESTELGTEAF